jgi:hypothetical protein
LPNVAAGMNRKFHDVEDSLRGLGMFGLNWNGNLMFERLFLKGEAAILSLRMLLMLSSIETFLCNISSIG